MVDPKPNRPRGAIRPHSSALDTLFRCSDGFIIFFSLYGLTLLHILQPERRTYYTSLGLVTLLFFYVAAEIEGVYRIWRGNSVWREAQTVLKTWLWVLPAILFTGYLLKVSALYSRQLLLTWFLVAPTALILWRLTIRWTLARVRSSGHNTRRAAVIGTGPMARHVRDLLERNTGGGFRVIGCYTDRPADHADTADNKAKGSVDDLVQEALEGRVDHVYLVASATDDATIARVVDLFSDTTVNLFVVPGLWVFELLHSRWSRLGDLPVISIYDVPVYGVNSWVKRMLDLVVGTAALLVAFLPMLIIAALIKLTSSGPVFFRQRRYGLDGKEILVWKFRTMRCAEDGDIIQQARPGDDRITPLGRWLRRTSLDEFPQLFNVLAGEMSLVGPRPHAVAHNREYRKLIRGYMLRHKIKPGITGLAQVHGCRGLTDTIEKMEERVEYDLEYIRNWSLLLDLRILFRTLMTMIRAPNAH